MIYVDGERVRSDSDNDYREEHVNKKEEGRVGIRVRSCWKVHE
jgi:hypothetical protein